MDHKEIDITEKFKILGAKYDDSDIPNFLSTLNTWLKYKNALKKIDGRNPNIPEALTEGIITRHFKNTYRKIKILKNGDKSLTKSDCYKEDTSEIIEVKGCSVKPDLTSWSPKPFFNFFCFVDFSSLDGKYKIYKIDISSDDLKSLKVNKNGETFQNQIDSKRRPRFSVYENFINCKKNCDGSPLYTGDLNQEI